MVNESETTPPEVNGSFSAGKTDQADAAAQQDANEFPGITKLSDIKLSEMSIKEIIIMIAAFIWVATVFLLKFCFKVGLAIGTFGISLLIEKNIKRNREQKKWDEKYANADELTRRSMDYMRSVAEQYNAERALANAQRLQEAKEKTRDIYERNKLKAEARKDNDFRRQMLRYQRAQTNIAKKRWALTKNEVRLKNYGRNSVWGSPFKNPDPKNADLLEDMVIYDDEI